MTQLQTERIQVALVALGREGPFYKRTYDRDTGNPDLDTDNPVIPRSVFCKEVGMNFVTAPENRRRFTRDVLGWQFELEMMFQQEVSIEPFWDRIADQPPRIAPDEALGLRQVTLLILGGKVVHPQQQQPQTGTRVVFVFEAAQTPK